ncbi:MAG: hypothetical protein ACYC9Z_04410 [Casimicrobiaceae bacterium]
MNDERQSDADGESAPEPKSSVDQGRRRLGTLGLGGTAAILTVASRSAVAGWGTCTGSELASGNLSRVGTPNPCGCSPGFWWNNNGTALWTTAPTLYVSYPRTATFNGVFNVNFYTDPTVQLLAVGPSTTNPNNFGANDNTGMQAVAALLNAQYYGSRYPVLGLQTATAVIAAFQNACLALNPKQALAAFVSRVDIYDSTADLWCNGSPE